MTTDWKRKLREVAVAICKGIWFFISRFLVPIITVIGKFILFIILPIIWRFLREKVYPALLKLYLLLPWRRTITASALGVILIVIAILVSYSSESNTGLMNAGKPIKLPAKEGKLVKSLMTGDWDKQKAASRKILQQLGMTVLDDDALPAGHDTLYVIPPELTYLALDAGQKETTGRLTLAELAHLMNDLDFPFIKDQDPVILLQNGVRNWVKAALKKPKQTGAEAPLFLYSMAAQQLPAIDLTSDNWVADDYYFTHLELQVFLAAFYQALPEEQIRETSSITDLFFNKAYAEAGACSYAKDYYNSLGEQNGAADAASIGTTLMQQLANELTGLGMKGLGTVGEIAGKVMVPISIILKIQKLSMLYGSLDMTLTSNSKLVHKPAGNEAGKELTFTTKIGVDEKKYNEYLEQWNSSPAARNIKDCLSFFGLPMPTDMGDIASEVDQWAVTWGLIGNHATWGTDKNKFESISQRRMKLKRISKTHGEASFVVDINREDGQHEGDIVTGYVMGKATLHSDLPPVFGAYMEAGKSGASAADSQTGWGLMEILGLGNAMVDIVGGWVQRILDPEKYYNVAVIYHKHRFPDYSYEGTVTASNSAYEGGTDSYYIGLAGSIPMTHSTHQSSSYTARLEPTKISITPGRNEAYWYLGGEGRISSSYSHRIDASGSVGCIGGTNQINIRHAGSGSNTITVDAKSKINRWGSEKEGYTFSLNVSPASTYITYESTKKRTESPGGCEYVNPSERSETSKQSQQGGVPSLNETFTTKEAYPEIISGSKSVEVDGIITTWKWHFQRRDPSDNPTYVEGVGG